MQKKYSIGLILFIGLWGLMLLGCSNPSESKLAPETPEQVFEEEPEISVYMHQSNETAMLPLEEYLCGVVAAEMAVDWPQEALAAQAIMARTFTLEKILSGGVEARGTDASTDINEFQAYDAQKVNDAVREAVAQTRGEVLHYGGKLIKAWFFADGGGITAASSLEGLTYDKEETPYIKSVEDPGISLADNPNKEWQAAFPMNQVKEAIAKQIGTTPGDIAEVTIAETGPSGRAMKLQFGEHMIDAPSLRLSLGSSDMKSTLLTDVAIHDGMLHMTGKGYGHGVGMSQWGARALAEQGEKAHDIVTYFFEGVDVTKAYE